MSQLFERIKRAGTTNTYTPNRVYGMGEPGRLDASGMPYPPIKTAGLYRAPREVPLVRIGIYDGIVSYEQDQPLNDPSGNTLMVPENKPGSGTWGQLYRAGRIY